MKISILFAKIIAFYLCCNQSINVRESKKKNASPEINLSTRMTIVLTFEQNPGLRNIDQCTIVGIEFDAGLYR